MGNRLMAPADFEPDSGGTGPNLLQLTAATFLVPGAVCVAQGRLVGVCVHCSNAVCSAYVHRPDRTAANDAVDVLDHILVFAWVCYNVFVLASAPPQPWAVGAATGCALMVAATKVRTRYLTYRSLSRYRVHAAMHLFGTLGSTLLLI